MTRVPILSALALLAGCGSTPERVPYTDPRVQVLPAGQLAGKVDRAQGKVIPPVRISKPKLSLLAELARSGEWQIGFCILEAVITDEGEVTRVKLLQPSSLAPEVERALRAEVQSWRFEPATKDGRPVGVHYKVTLDHCPLRPSAPPAG